VGESKRLWRWVSLDPRDAMGGIFGRGLGFWRRARRSSSSPPVGTCSRAGAGGGGAGAEAGGGGAGAGAGAGGGGAGGPGG